MARWSGARRGEIQRLAVDCLDRYPDGTARLRLPAGKTYRERIVPLHEEATALQALIDFRIQRGVGSGRDGESPHRPPVGTRHAQLMHVGEAV
jgi:integrase